MNKLWAAMIVPVVGFFGAMANVYADSTLVTVNISNTSLELDVPASPTILTLNPTASGANFGYVDLTATVGTNNPTGYTLSVTFSDTSLTRTSAVGGTTPTISTLDTLAGGYPVADFTVNRWGHKITGDNYFPVPSSTLSPESWSSDEPVNNAPNVITLAAKADGTIPSGIYETTLTYTLVANVATSMSFEDAYAAAGKTRDNNTGKYKLQDMNASICANVDTSTAADNSDTQEAQLVDTRDGKIYWVAKLKDGKCWMTQNLDLDLETTPNHVAALTPSNTDISAAWSPENATSTVLSNSFSDSGWSYDDNNPYSADPGDWYWDGDYSSTACNYLTYNSCTHFSISPFSNGTHGHVGNYYNWAAAIASNDSSSITSSAPGSICPAGWRLPTGSPSGELNALNSQYGNDFSTDANLIASPLWFVRGGNVHNGYYDLNDEGYGGYYWSSMVYNSSGYTTNQAHDLVFHSSSVDQENPHPKNNGLSVRCVAR